MSQLPSGPVNHKLTDDEIAILFKQANDDIWIYIVTNYTLFLRKYLIKRWSYFNEEDREDILQETFGYVYREIRKGNPYNGKIPFEAYLIIHAKYKCYDFIKRVNHGQHQNISDLNHEEAQIEDISTSIEVRESLQTLLQSLSPEEERVIRLHVYQRKALKDIAKELGMPEGTVRSLKSRALKKLQKLASGKPEFADYQQQIE